MDATGHQSEAPQGAERRRHRRFPCEGYAEVVCCHPTVLFRGRIRDISLTGCFIETAARLQLARMTEVEVRFTASGRHISSPARIMDIRPGRGAGFEFLPGDRGMQAPFLKLLEMLKQTAEAAPPVEAARPRWVSGAANSRR